MLVFIIVPINSLILKVACFTEEDWRELCDSLENATSKNEKVLYRTLKEDFLPEIPNLFAEKERQQRYLFPIYSSARLFCDLCIVLIESECLMRLPGGHLQESRN